MTGWVAVGRTATGACAFALQDVRLVARAVAANERSALDELNLPDAPVLRIGDGAPARLPAPVLPDQGPGLPGFAQDTPPDVIGAWVRVWIAGYLAERPGWDGVICATEGDVSHWIHVSADEAVSCQSFLTPRLVQALGGAATPDADAMADSQSRPERLAAHLRAAEVSGNAQAVTGHLIGAELAAARVYWLGQQVAVLAPSPSPMSAALHHQGVPCEACDPETLVAPGLAEIGKVLGYGV